MLIFLFVKFICKIFCIFVLFVGRLVLLVIEIVKFLVLFGCKFVVDV